jgi:hypothetical protein
LVGARPENRNITTRRWRLTAACSRRARTAAGLMLDG